MGHLPDLRISINSPVPFVSYFSLWSNANFHLIKEVNALYPSLSQLERAELIPQETQQQSTPDMISIYSLYSLLLD